MVNQWVRSLYLKSIEMFLAATPQLSPISDIVAPDSPQFSYSKSWKLAGINQFVKGILADIKQIHHFSRSQVFVFNFRDFIIVKVVIRVIHVVCTSEFLFCNLT